jgi:hypothetical protein
LGDAAQGKGFETFHDVTIRIGATDPSCGWDDSSCHPIPHADPPPGLRLLDAAH